VSSAGNLPADSRPSLPLSIVATPLLTLAVATAMDYVPRAAPFFVAGDTSPGMRGIALQWFAHQLRYDVLIFGLTVIAFAAWPLILRLRTELRASWRSGFDTSALAAACLFFTAFIVFFGRRQFGGYDHSILVDMGWREYLGQHPYTGFPATTPPLFNLGMACAYRLFGVRWDANLHATALFTCITFLWLYSLLRRFPLSRPVAYLTAFAVQSAATLTLCFWWYNNTTLVLAAVFYANCLVLLHRPASRPEHETRWAEWSFPLAFALLALTKPNIAGIVLLSGTLILLVASPRRGRLLILASIGAALAVLLLLAGHVSIPHMLSSYRAISRERGLFSDFGLAPRLPLERLIIAYWFFLLSLPILGLVLTLRTQLRDRRLPMLLLLLIGPLVAFYGLRTNGEFQDVECTCLLLAGVVAVAGLGTAPPQSRRFYFALMIAMIGSDLYLGAERLRVFTIGPLRFFEWNNATHTVMSGYFRGLHTGPIFTADEAEIAQALKDQPGTVYFGPRLEFNYASFGIAPPADLPIWWEPGTAFASSEQQHVIALWQHHQFATLIFLHGDYMYYPKAFTDRILDGYARDARYPDLDVWRLKALDSPTHQQ
jgi:hypothetical protein